MKISASKVLALGGLCALFVGAGNVAFAQSDNHQDRNNDQGQSRQSDRHDDHGQNNQDWQHKQHNQNWQHGQHSQNWQHGQNNQNWQHGQNNQNWQHGQTQYHHGQYNQTQNHDAWVKESQYRRESRYRQANQNERRRLDRLHAAYAHDAASGHYNAAERAHQHAQAIRARLHSQHRDNNQDRHHTN